ncbi:MAG: triple tyrosine motif-containing protein, partial [Bacteroidota bacterium]
ISDILEDKKRNLIWVASSYGGISAIDLNSTRVVKSLRLDYDGTALAFHQIKCLCLQGDTLWFGGTAGLRAFDIKTDRYLSLIPLFKTKIGYSSGLPDVAKFTTDNSGTVWVFCDGLGLLMIKPLTGSSKLFSTEFFKTSSNNKKLSFWDLTRSGDTICLSTSWGVRLLDANNFSLNNHFISTTSVLDTTEVFSAAFSSSHQLSATSPGQFIRCDLLTKKIFFYRDNNQGDDNWLSRGYQLYADQLSGTMWIGTQSGLANFSVNKPVFTSFYNDVTSGSKISHAYSLLPVSDEFVFCGDENGLFLVNTKTGNIKKTDGGSSAFLVAKDSSGNIFVSNNDGFFLLQDGKTIPVSKRFPFLRPLESDRLNSFLQFNDSIYLFGSVIQKGLSVWNKKSGRFLTYHKDSVEHLIRELNVINNIYKSKNGKVFILTDKNVFEFNPLSGAYHPIELRGQNGEVITANFMDICDAGDNFWFATYGNGLFVSGPDFKIVHNLSVQNGLSNNCTYRLVLFHDSTIMVTSNKGLGIIDTRTYTIKNYFQSDGLNTNSFEQLCASKNGTKLLAGGTNGFTMIDPDVFTANKNAPLFYFTNIKIQSREKSADTAGFDLRRLEIPSDVVQVTINFTGINYKNPDRVRYMYRIGKINDNWLETGPEEYINLIGLSPGEYKIEMKAGNEDNRWSAPREIILIFQPRWYQTSIFKLSVVGAIALLIYILFRYRLRQLKIQQQIRRDIAGDLHDDIGSTLNSIKIFTHLARKEPDKQDHLLKIDEFLTFATSGLRDMIWVLDNSEDTVYGLIERLKKYAVPVCLVKNIEFIATVETGPQSGLLSKTEKRNLLLIAKELINNSVKYAQCSIIRVNIKLENNKYSLTVADDGVGYDTNSPHTGYGLQNVAYRARQIHFEIAINSSSESGTIVRIFQNK